MRRTSCSLIALAAAALFSLACQGRPVASPQDLFTTDVIARTAKDVEAKVGAPLRVLDLQAENGSFRLQVQDPKKPENVDQYELRKGTLTGPAPVQLMGPGDLETSLYPIADVDLTKIPAFTQAALAALAFEDGKPTSLRIRVDEPYDSISRRIRGETVEPRITVTMYVDSPRKRGMVLADKGFEILKSTVF